MDRQETYDKVRDHLMTQGKRSGEKYKCLYKGPYGRRCAIGALIPDELFNKNYDNINVFGLSFEIKRYLCGGDPGGLRFLGGLQSIHDSIEPENWAAALYDFAVSQGLRP